MLADRGTADDLDRLTESLDHPADEEQLLRVLLPEVGRGGTDHVEQAVDRREHAGEVARPRGSLPHVPDRTRVRRRQLDALRIELPFGRRPHQVGPQGLGQRDIPRLVPGVARQVLARRELPRVHEDRHDDHAPLGPGAADQRRVAVMQRSHRRHEADVGAGGPACFDGRGEIGGPADQLHRSSASSTAARPAADRRPEDDASSSAARQSST